MVMKVLEIELESVDDQGYCTYHAQISTGHGVMYSIREDSVLFKSFTTATSRKVKAPKHGSSTMEFKLIHVVMNYINRNTYSLEREQNELPK